MPDMSDADEPNTETPVNLSPFTPTERMRRYKLTVEFTPRGPLKPPFPPPASVSLICKGIDHANEIRAELQPNPKQMFGPLVQIHARWAKLLNLPDLSVFQFYTPSVAQPEALDVQPIRSLQPKLRANRIALSGPLDPAPGISTPSGSSIPNRPAELDLDELLGSSPVFPERETDFLQDGISSEDDQEDS